MPYRKIPLVTGELYHIYNRGVARAPTFINKRCYSRFVRTLTYYKYANCPTKLSHFLPLSREERNELEERLIAEGNKLLELMCFCAMPIHFHILVKQLLDGGISEYMRKITHSYTKYFNLTTERVGPLFQGPFKAVHIETDEQLIHVSRYIHINPYIGGVVTRERLRSYPYSSLPEYFYSYESRLVDKFIIMSLFKSARQYEKFVFDEADYRKSQEKIVHLIVE